MMNRIITTLIVVLLCTVDILSAQEKVLERDVKVSGNYYYGDGSASSENEAKSAAIEELKIMISESIRLDNPNITTINFGNIDDAIGTISVDLESYVRVVAYVLKSEVAQASSGSQTLTVNHNGSSAVTSAPNSVKEPEVSATTTAVATPQVVETPKTVVEETKVKEVVASSEPTKTIDVVSPSTQKVETSSAQVQTTVAAPTQTTNEEQNHPIVNEILKLTESKDVGTLLDKYKNMGKLGYGRVNTISDPENCYFVVLRSGALVDVLDKGSGSSRMGLISGSYVNYSKSYDTIYWVYIY